MTGHLENVAHVEHEMAECIGRCGECQELCLAAVPHAAPDLTGRLLDCAKACETARDLMLRGSPLHPGYCRGCVHACGSCASACEKFPDDELLVACAKACRLAMESCRAMGGHDRH